MSKGNRNAKKSGRGSGETLERIPDLDAAAIAGDELEPTAAAAATAENGELVPPKPAGSAEREQVEGRLTRCTKCGSTKRTKYSNRREIPHGGVDADGKPFTHVVWRNTCCADCGQARVDRHLENRQAAAVA